MTCSSCGAALADDQRYCLNCGQRQGEARVDFSRHLDSKQAATKAGPASPDPAAEPNPAPPEPGKPQRDYAPLAAAGGIAVLGIMLLIGVLIGRGTGDSNDSASTPQVITVGAAPATAGSKSADEGSADAGSGGKKGSGGKAAKKQNTAGGSTDTGNAPVASDDQLEALQQKTGDDYSKESAKLPDEIATPGAPPPTDKKAPGGGSGGVTLE
ncbi:MAG TPA: zinc ribbon domain-containing protein [Solirubrobacterales bacterium]